MIVLGVDPDLHNTGLALADEKRVYAVGLVQVDKKLKGEAAVCAMGEALERLVPDFYRSSNVPGYFPDHVVVEGQQLYLGGSRPKATPEDLLNLAFVAGAARAASECEHARRPLPKEWKGDVPKAIHQARVCARYGWSCEAKSDYVIPRMLPGQEPPVGIIEISPLSNWRHVMDAIGLAHWGATKGFK